MSTRKNMVEKRKEKNGENKWKNEEKNGKKKENQICMYTQRGESKKETKECYEPQTCVPQCMWYH